MATQTQDEVLSASHIPSHVAIIMDGNGRWAKQRGLPRTEGHIRGQDALRTTLRAAARRGIKYLTVYTFSTENWSRPQEEVDALMSILVSAIHAETPQLIAEGVRMRAIGDLSRLPQQAQDSLAESIELTKDGTQITLILALSYSSRDEIRRASQRLAAEAAAGRLRPEEITEELISSYLDTAEYPDPDLVIRTGGEERISNYLLWQSAYSELYFSETYWPDFGQEALDEALAAYASRERRFGKTSEQIQLED
ncbi:MAG: isoprenyl transferase [Porphyromonadaceae bacterium]|nr:isoprenyl transferase [Porphyromonadaceae bacterium]